ncbi:type I-E CRISPR-associated protein Cse1/CasA, partial [Novacetimonas pomaceti]
GESTIKRNADLFVHRGQVERLGRATAAMALFTLQSWAPSGGAGNMTGLRGGGPLTTLVLPLDEVRLWDVIWANVPCGKAAKDADMNRVFPWMAPTRISGKGGEEVRVGEDAHPLQCWWGMPRRIRLDFEKVQGGRCDLTRQPDNMLVTGWRQRPRGPEYAGWIGMPYGKEAVIHPLTPRYRQKADGEWLAVHPQPGGIGYRHWTGVVVNSADANRLPASCVVTWRNERAREAGISGYARLLVAGFDMDNMKVRSFVESEMPLVGTKDEKEQKALDELTCQCVGVATQVADILRGSVRDAIFGGGKVSVDVTLLSNVRERFWMDTENGFHAALQAAATGGNDYLTVKKNWLRILALAALREFDATVVLEPDTPTTEAQRAAKARMRLCAVVSGSGKESEKILRELDIPCPVKKNQKTSEKVS